MSNLRDGHLTDVFHRAAERASLAPSVHNTQPWRFTLRKDCLELHADFSRQLKVLDPTGRQLHVSCGCALLNLRVAMAAEGRDVTVERLPDPEHPTLLARLTPTGEPADWTPLSRLEPQLERRRTNRRRFATDPVPAELRYEMIQAVDEESALFFELRSEKQRAIVAELSQEADAVQNADPSYRAELRAWTTDDLTRRDGVPAMAVPHVDGHSGDEIPIRDFDTHGRGWLPTKTESTQDQFLMLLGGSEDNPLAWLRTGEALERLWLEITRHDLVASLLTQVVEVSVTRDVLRRELQLSMFPHVLLRIGRAPETAATRRRDLDDLITQAVE